SSRAYEQLVLERCDTIIWLDYPVWRLLASVVARTLRRAITRERLWNGNVEGWRQVFSLEGSIPFVWRYYPRERREYGPMFRDGVPGKTLIRFCRRREVNRWLASLEVPTRR